MIRGFIALLTSGILLNPMILLGIAVASYIMFSLSMEDVGNLLKNRLLYISFLIIATMFTVAFKRIYRTGGEKTNWRATAGEILNQFLTLTSAMLLCCLLLYILGVGSGDEIAAHLSAQ